MNKIQIKKCNLQVPSTYIRNFYDLSDAITEEFKILYHDFYRGEIQLTSDFVDKSKLLFSNFDDKNKVALSNGYFENFTPITGKLIMMGQYKKAFNFWNEIILFVTEWEKSNNKKLHKGTPYYFSSVAAILGMDFDAALISMHLALTEDKLNYENYKETPAYYFLTLNDKKREQYFKPFVDGMVGFLRDRLDGQGHAQGKYKDNYLKSRKGSLTYEELRRNFLDNDDISEEIKYFFVYSTIRIWRLRILQKSKIGDNIVAPIVFVQALGGLLITIESLLKLKYKLKYFGNLFEKLAKVEGWQTPNISDINKQCDEDFENWVDTCLNQNTLFGDLSLSYGLRNFAFHTIKSQQKLWQDYTKVLQSVLNCFFKSIENL
jgi:hypothetical protein